MFELCIAPLYFF